MKDHHRSQSYQKVKNSLFFVSLSLDFIFLCLFFFSGLSAHLKNFALTLTPHFFWVNAIYLTGFCLGMYLLHFPMSYFSGYYWEHRFHLSNQKFLSWLSDDLKKAMLCFILILVLAEGVYVFLRSFVHSWWVFAGTFWLFLMFIIAKIVPDVIVPLFYKYSLIEDEALREKIMRLFQKHEVNLKNVYAIDLSTKTKKANAMLCGMGKSRRVILSDTLLQNFTSEEIEVIAAHEMAHYKHHDILKLLAMNALMIFGGLFFVNQYLQASLARYGVSGIHDISFLPMILIIFMLFGLVTMPLLNFISRMIEKQADLFSLEATGNKEAFISAMRKLGRLNLAEERPAWLSELFLYDHPPLYKRIQMAQRMKASR